MVVTCEIQFDQNPTGTFFAGQLINGSVTLKSDKPKDVMGVLLKILGIARTSWTERRFNSRDLYSGGEDYISSITYLLGSDKSITKSTIKCGTHIYTFACQLPYNCPSSFEGHFGFVRYVAKVDLIRPWKFDQTYTRAFTVLKMVDLNYDTHQLKIPANSSAYRTFCCGPFKTEPLKLEVRTPQSGYVPGQRIPVTVVVINNSSIPVAEVRFGLIMLIRYFSQSPVKRSRVERLVIAQGKGDSVLGNCTRSLHCELQVPSTPPSCLNLCNVIQIVYQVEVEAKMKNFHGSQSIALPVLIGNIPLWRSPAVSHQPRTSRADSKASCHETPIMNPIAIAESTASVRRPSHLYPDLPPASYEESTHTVRVDINEEELHTFGPNEFAPLYPVYDMPSPTAPNARTNALAAVAAAAAAAGGGHDNPNFQN